jgi:hypothetical protein
MTIIFIVVQISIELKHHFKSADRKDAEDTWTLKIKHVSKRYKVPRNEDEFYYKNEVDVDEQSSQRNKDLWEQTTQATYNDIKDVHKPMFIKFRRPGKVKRGKYRRKLSPRSQVTSESNVTATLDGTDTQLTLPEPPIFKELVQENQRLQVSFDRNGNDTSQMEKTDEAFQEFDETQWDNVAAVLLDSTANHTLPVDQQEDQEEVHATESSINQEHEKLMESYALPLKQYEDSDGFEAEENTTTLEETNEKEHNYNIERMKASGGVDINDYKERNSKHSTAGSDIAGIFDQEKRAVIESDYVIEDPTVREYDKEDVEDEEEYKYGNRQDDHGDYEPTSEMKRIMDWFPRSTLLTTENNGYKLFPGVSACSSGLVRKYGGLEEATVNSCLLEEVLYFPVTHLKGESGLNSLDIRVFIHVTQTLLYLKLFKIKNNIHKFLRGCFKSSLSV